ncbi:cadherin-like and PC-esterase domain-containing protein 1 isoform X2 [Antennarius striatus]|uniref:cadherin-like and PC-esterase domain-containing protein 1 isoform X2 n=1 Tax=Antennarius striatus TaxID=241820 RepID=UPI0035B139F8
MLLRRRFCSGPLLLLLGAGVCLFYRTLMGGRNRVRSGRPVTRRRPAEEDPLEETRSLISALDRIQNQAWSWPRPRRRAAVLTGRRLRSDTEVQLYQRVLGQMDYQVQLAPSAETSSFLRDNTGVSGWSLLVCLSSSERSCVRRMSLSHLHHHQRVNLMPELREAFSDAGGGLCNFYTRPQLTESELPIRPHSCGLTNEKLQVGTDSPPPARAPPPALVAMVNLYVLVTSVKPLTSFLHDVSVVKTSQEPRGRVTKLRKLLLQQLGPVTSHEALQQVKKVIGDVLTVAVSTNQKQEALSRCVLCYQLLTFTLLLGGSVTPVVVQVDPDLTLWSLSDPFDRQITRDLILEDTLYFLLPSTPLWSGRRGRQDGGCRATGGVCLSDDDFLILLQFQRLMKTSSPFLPLHPGVSSSSSSSSGPRGISDLLVGIARFYERRRSGVTTNETERAPAGAGGGPCVDPHLRQIYTAPPLTLTPPFSPWVKQYHAEVTFDTVTVRIRPEPASPACRVHLDEQGGPRMANYPVGLGNSRISILVTDGAGLEPVVMATYTIQVFRESRPSLPMFGDHMMCGFVQVLFIGDSTNRGMMYFLLERVNASLEAWGRAHDTRVYQGLNGGRTLVGFSYYPQFWLDRKSRPTFREALLQLLHRSRPLANSNQTVLVVGGVQWLNTDHLRTVSEVLSSESLGDILVVVKSLGMGFHLPVDGVRSLSLTEVQDLYRENHQIVSAAKHHGYEVIDTFSITMGRHKEFLQGRCACHFHEVEKVGSAGLSHGTRSTTNRTAPPSAGPALHSQSSVLDTEQEAGPKSSSYHVRGPVNEVYSEILLSRLCPRTRG